MTPGRTVLFAAAGVVLAASLRAASPSPTATPTPRPRLSGGFGKAEATPAPARGGQALADVVRAASESKKERETPKTTGGVSITNQSLVTDPNRGKLSTSRVTPASKSGPTSGARMRETAPPSAATPVPTVAAAEPGSEADASGEEARWQEIARRARERVVSDRDAVARLEAETKKLENDFYSWDDGQYRDNVIKPSWDKKREELETARRELSDAERDLADLPERARKAGALPGWIRE